MKLAIGFITYKKTTIKYLPFFLPSLFKALEPVSDYKIFCWDNSETVDENVDFITKNFAEVEIMSEHKNLGFAKAYNKLITKVGERGAEYFLAINPDTLLEPEAVVEMLKVMDEDKDLGSVSPKILCWDFVNKNETDIIDTCGIKLKSGLKFIDLGQGSKDLGQFDKTEILGPSGAAGLFRISALEKITKNKQYFDELMFMYKEDCDLVYRLELSGFKARIVPEAIIYHDRSVKGAKTGFLAFFRGRRAKSRLVKQWSWLNQHIIFIKHWNKQNFLNKLMILARVKGMMIYALLFEQYLLKEYVKLWKIRNKIKKYGL